MAATQDSLSSPMGEFTPVEMRRYSRHLILPDFGLVGQKKLRAARVLIIGTGGLGSPVSMYLAAAGVGTLGLVDFDRVDETNLQRQIVHSTSTVGQLKVESARARLLDINPHINVITYPEPFTSVNAMEIAGSYDVIVDGTDNFPNRYLSNDVCVLLGKPNIYGSVYRYEGQAAVFCMKDGPCYRCLFPTPPPPHSVPSCAEGGVLGVLPGMIGLVQATETIKVITGIGQTLSGYLLVYDALTMTFEKVKLKKNPQCVICSEHATLDHLIDYDQFCGFPGQAHAPDEPYEASISPIELATRLRDSSAPPLRLIDVREQHEWEFAHIPGAELIPLDQLDTRLGELNPDDDIVVYCRTERRVHDALDLLQAFGFHRIRKLAGGIVAWAHDVDPDMPTYW
jgi:molybdopterin/thiamine biosynthesis adenylyltransferase/rhodanese-related sulfurtransferase